jgi:Uma2 family endonuclease
MSQTIDLTRTYTADEFEKLPEFNENYELVDGRLVKKPMPGYEHSWIAGVIMRAVWSFDPGMKLGIMLAEANTKLSPKNVSQPDLSYWTAARRPSPRTKGAGPRPDLAVEIWSPGDLDTQQNLAEARAKILRYLAAGVPLVWAINPKEKIVEVYRTGQLEPEILDLENTLDGEGIIPGFKLPIIELFEEEEEEEQEL